MPNSHIEGNVSATILYFAENLSRDLPQSIS